MSRLVVLEMRRAVGRRMVRVLVLVAVLLIALTGVLVFVNAEPDGPDAQDLARAQQVRAQMIEQCEVEVAAGHGPPSCAEAIPPAALLVEDKRFKLVDLWKRGGDDSVFAVTAVFLLVGGIIGGASFVGAEWKAGTVGTLLTWEPRRLRVLAAKLVAAALVAFVVAVLLHGLMALALWPSASLRGTTEGADAGWLRSLLGAVFRISGLTAGVAVAGACIASVGRNTAAGIGICLGYALVAERIVQQLRPTWRPWLLLENAVIALTGERLNDAVVRNTLGRALLVLTGYLGLVVAVALLDFRRRDVA